MQDIRLRTGTAALLSLAAFTGITGAVVVFIWWLAFSHPLKVLKEMRMVIPAIMVIVFFSLVLELTGGGGISYCLRMTVIILIGAWVYTGYRQGEFIGLGTWLFGKKTGFDLGMIAVQEHVRDTQATKLARPGVLGIFEPPALERLVVKRLFAPQHSRQQPDDAVDDRQAGNLASRQNEIAEADFFRRQ